MSIVADRLVYDEDGKLDDLWQTGVNVHIERMGRRDYWGALYFSDGTRITFSSARVSIIEERLSPDMPSGKDD